MKMTDLITSLRTMVPIGREFTVEERAAAAIVSQEAADEIERLRKEMADGSFYKESDIDQMQDEIDRLRSENARLLSMMAKAHAVMRETGWQLAPASIDPEADGVLELAAAEIESEFASVLSKPTELETNAS